MRAVDKALGSHVTDRKAVYTRLWKPIDLNKSTKDEMKLIPGVGDRMAHEFEEYRPWTSVEQFRREIGKYVDKDEVARLEQYVSIPK
jgi:DNA uptake protein ComE-like DNA-binding protein